MHPESTPLKSVADLERGSGHLEDDIAGNLALDPHSANRVSRTSDRGITRHDATTAREGVSRLKGRMGISAYARKAS